jgi:hypothetical protein
MSLRFAALRPAAARIWIARPIFSLVSRSLETVPSYYQSRLAALEL